MLTANSILAFQDHILTRYNENKRELPRRDSTNSYHVLVSETMSQQTQVSRVIPKFLHFIEVLPDYKALAYCDQKTLLTLRSGLGYNNRALRLQAAAKTIHEQHHNILPQDEKTLLALPGIGMYTAHALLAFVYNADVPVLDINIRRVISHRFVLSQEISDKELRNIAYSLIPPGQSKDRHNALMDYGALVLTSKKTGIKSKPQSTFQGSTRRVRGSILKKLIADGAQDLKILQDLFPHEKFETIIQKMITDKLVSLEGNMLFIP